MICVIPYAPRAHWKGPDGLHAQLDRHRFSVIVAHRRFGKTLGVINHVIKRALLFPGGDGRFGYVAPYRGQAKAIAWDYLKRFAAPVPGVAYSEGELAVSFPNGARIRLFGADNPDALRGLYFDGLIVDEVADIKPEVWGEVLRPALSDRKGWCVFIGTPKGQNVFFEKYREALSTEGWFAGLFRADETGVLPEEELEALRAEMSDNQFRQEMLCDFTAAADNVLIPLDLVLAAQKRVLRETDVSYAPLVMGYDVARMGDDEAVLAVRKGFLCFAQKRYRKLDITTQTGILAREFDERKPDAVFIDAGAMGGGLIDNLRSFGFRVMEVHFGASPFNPKYLNRRAEMWGEMAQWLRGASLPDDARLCQELTLPTYSFNAAGKLRLEEKDKIKQRLGFSPDGADALALTFAAPVRTGGVRVRGADYSVLKNM
ncbi:MAG: terminase family protein [Acidaminococcales bacterium]|jgi:hypothetical protein|nr:terminase family protein [Acidaminococcales bacterium]